MNRLLALSLLLSASVLAGCAAGNHPELRPYSAEETHQLALEDLNRRGLSYDEFQARKAQLMEQPQLQRAHEFDNRGEVNADIGIPSKARQG
ncbi:hypothetical protein [Pseudomonas lutea]|jgi:hypothetical protein|uniref:Lipoprotein n=1 Tax=Pseudomonas lutea TaxID=243924 RepID=A0A9X0EBJ0_9PSED|nr:hypothetical protein [Pseudomonas lutea]KGF62813.1 lipoprotein [Pseudomonas lutea]